MKKFFPQGQALLVAVIIVGFAAVAGAIYLISSVSTDTLMQSNFSSSLKNLTYAQSGIDDALMKIARDKNYTGGYNLLPPDSLATINIEVKKDIPEVGKTTVSSVSDFQKSKKKIEVILSIDSQGKINISSYRLIN